MRSTLPDFETLRLVRVGPLTWVTLHRPNRLNAMNDVLLEELDAALDWLAVDASTVVLGIRGEGRAFSAGFDVKRDEASGYVAAADVVADHDQLRGRLERFLRIWDHPKPVIAAVHGHCLAAATVLCSLCDMTVVANDAVIGMPSLPLGGGFNTPVWVYLVGPKRAKQLEFEAGCQISGQTAADWGWANYGVPAERLFEEVEQLAARIARTPSPVLRMKKLAINRVVEAMGLRLVLPMGAETDALLHQSQAIREINRAIVEKGLKKTIEDFRSG